MVEGGVGERGEIDLDGGGVGGDVKAFEEEGVVGTGVGGVHVEV